jgi:hypothetical protein
MSSADEKEAGNTRALSNKRNKNLRIGLRTVSLGDCDRHTRQGESAPRTDAVSCETDEFSEQEWSYSKARRQTRAFHPTAEFR